MQWPRGDGLLAAPDCCHRITARDCLQVSGHELRISLASFHATFALPRLPRQRTLLPRQTAAAGSGGLAVLDNARNCYLRAKGVLTPAGQTTALKLFDVGTPPGPTTKKL
jgi:hypothetical protein